MALLIATVANAGIKVRVGGKRVDAEAKTRGDEVRVLFIGNSLTYFNEMPWLTEEVARSLRVKPALRTDFSGRSGATLRQHWQRGRAVQALREVRYDYVVLQPQGTEIMRPEAETFRYAKLLDEEIRRSGAKTLLFLNWSTASHKQADYNRQFARLAAELKAPVAPVGIVWESLRREGVKLDDGHHPNVVGSYVNACVFVAAIYGRSTNNAVYNFDVDFDERQFHRQSLENDTIDGVTAARIHRAVWAAVSGMKK